jgi:hypothetical protein
VVGNDSIVFFGHLSVEGSESSLKVNERHAYGVCS